MTKRGEWAAFVAFVLPGVVLFGLFTWWPILYSVFLSVTEWRMPAPEPRFVGLSNYGELLASSRFWRVMLNTIVYASVVVVAAQVIAFGLAALLARPIPGRALWRTLAFTPYVTTPAAAAIVWVLVLDPKMGPLATVYEFLRIEGPHWLSHSILALGAVMLVGIWKEAGFATVFYLAGRQNLPMDAFEAAAIDGAGRWQTFRRLTVPLMTPVVFFLLVSGFVAAAKVFDTVALMTQGGPVYPDSSTFVYHLYVLAFREYRMGFACAFSVIFVMFLGGFTMIQFRFARNWIPLDRG